MTDIMKNRLGILGVYLVMLLIVSCAPAVTVQYYRPISSEGEVVNAHCPPVDSFILFEKHDIIVGVHAAYNEAGKVTATMTFEVPQDKTAKLFDQHIEIHIPSQGSSKVRLSGYTWIGPGRTSDFSPETPLIGKTKKSFLLKQVTLYGTTNHAYYVFSASIDILKPEQITIIAPRFSVDGFNVELPKIKFEWSNKYFPVYPANC